MRRLPIALAAVSLIFLGACNKAQKQDAQFEYNPAALAKSAAEAKAFMEANAKKPGVVSLPSGVQYKIVKSGPAGGESPTPEDEVKVNYEGALTNGTVFDSSYKSGSPVVFQLGGLIPGWIDAMQHMKPGDEWVLYVPPELGYGDNSPPPIPANSVLVFKLELLGVLKAGGGNANG